jgi:hypothetical protein
MTGQEAATLFASLVTLTVVVVVGLDWWGRRKDRRSQAK